MLSDSLSRTLAVLALVTLPAAALPAQERIPPAPPTEASTDVGNWGFLPFAVPETLILAPEQRQVLRELEDRQLDELRALEDRYAADLRALRQRQTEERTALVGSLAR
jgi:Spy/CpxP family protein refolding chaperone